MIDMLTLFRPTPQNSVALFSCVRADKSSIEC